MHVLLVQFDIVWEDKPANHRVVEDMLRTAAPSPESFILLPELGDTGFSINLEKIADDRSLPWAQSLARSHQSWVQAGYAELAQDGKGRNCVAIINPAGEVESIYRKVHPFSYGRESTYFGGGERLSVIELDNATIAPLICYDLRFPELWRLAVRAGAEVFTVSACWPQSRQAHWRALLIARAIENQAYVLGVNRVGRDPNVTYAGGSIIISPRGEVVAEAGDAPVVLRATLDPAEVRGWRSEFPALRDIHDEFLGSIPIDRASARTSSTSA